MGVDLDQIVAMLYEAQGNLDMAIEEAQRGVIVAAIAKGSSILKEGHAGGFARFCHAREIREAIERGERETVPWAEVKSRLKKKGLLDE